MIKIHTIKFFLLFLALLLPLNNTEHAHAMLDTEFLSMKVQDGYCHEKKHNKNS